MAHKATSPPVGVSRLRAAGLVTLESTSVMVAFGAVEHEIAVTHRIFPNGGSWSFFVCPCCSRRARTLRLVEGQPLCRWCGGYHGARDPNRIERLKAKLFGPPLRLKPRPGRTMDRRQETEAALRRLMIVERRERLGKAHGPPHP